MKMIVRENGFDVVDVFGREVEAGDFVAAATMSHKRAHLRVGQVIRVSEKGNVSMRPAQVSGKDFSLTISRPIVLTNARFMIIGKDQLPERVESLFDMPR